MDAATDPGLWSADRSQSPPVVTDHSSLVAGVGDPVVSPDGTYPHTSGTCTPSSVACCWRPDDLYAPAIVVQRNKKAPVPNVRSCIFLHVWTGPQTPVTGCTAMAREDPQTLARWLRPDHARVVALPRSEYEALREAWQLP